ncbi:MAG: response regulator [Planctomycetes bacterium]|nr:response regulator [Planctomycetota bacterium]
MDHHILIVDDDENFLDFARLALERTHARVTTVASAEEALAAARCERPSLILLDIGLPGLDGYDVCEMLSGDGIPILFVSGHPYRDERLSAQFTGAVGYVQKPVKPEDLRTAVRKALTGSSAARRPRGGAAPRRK